MPLWAVILGWFFGCSGLLVLNARLSERPPRLRISHVDEKTGLTWTKGLGSGESSAYDTVQIIMDQLPKSRLGINLVHNQVTVSRVVVREAFNAGWRVGDVILEVDGKQVRSNKAVQRAVRQALLQKKLPLSFKVRRWAVPDGSRGMLQLTKDGHREHLVPMLDIVKGVLQEFRVVLFLEGPLTEPKTRLSRRVVQRLDALGLPFKAIDCSNEKSNPSIRKIAKELSGEEVLPQLFINGTHVAGGRAIMVALEDKLPEKNRRLAAASAVAFLCRRPDVRHAKLAAKGSSTLAATAKTVDAKVFSDAWEKALDGREGNVFTEPEMFMEVLEHLNQTHSQKGPVYFERVSRAADEKKDIVLYVPGIDFSGAFAAPQFRGLAADFELWRCWVKPDCRESFYEMARQLEAWLESHQNRKVVLLGESFGGLLSLAVALRLGREKLKGLVLVNPATSFDRTVWPLLGRVLAAVPNELGNLPPMGSHKDLNELFEDIQSRATLSPYPYLAGSALTGTVADSTQLGRLFSRIGLQILNSGSTLDPSVENFLLYPENLAQLLPPETVKFRLRHWLRDGCEWVNSELRRRRGASFGGNALPPTCLVASDSDRLLMSDKEAKRLRGLLQARCGDKNLKVVELSESGHAPLDRRVKLAELLKDSPILKKVKGRNYVDEFEYPSLEVLEQGSRNIEPIAALVSPVFCSWDAASGKRRFGLGGVPDPKELQRPIILVGNHQLFALDLGPLVREFLIEKGYSPRGLAHPINFPEVLRTLTSTKVTMEESGLLDSINLPFELRAAARALEASDSKSSNGISGLFGLSPPTEEQNAPQSELGVGENFGVGGAFAKWGAVPVSPRNFFRLLQRKEIALFVSATLRARRSAWRSVVSAAAASRGTCTMRCVKAILLFPGGAREACHGATEKYKLMWPKQTDFVRLAARFNAIVVPFGGIGSADNVRIGEDEASEQERQGFSEMMDGGMNVVSDSLREPPRFKPAPPRFPPATQTRAGFGDRFYFSFGAPVDLADVDPKDKDACEEVYQKLKGDVEGEINWLLEARVRDPNRDFITRQLKERVMNLDPQPKEVKAGPLKGNFIRSCGRRAPSFPLE